jgi:hypothetical protein
MNKLDKNPQKNKKLFHILAQALRVLRGEIKLPDIRINKGFLEVRLRPSPPNEYAAAGICAIIQKLEYENLLPKNSKRVFEEYISSVFGIDDNSYLFLPGEIKQRENWLRNEIEALTIKQTIFVLSIISDILKRKVKFISFDILYNRNRFYTRTYNLQAHHFEFERSNIELVMLSLWENNMISVSDHVIIDHFIKEKDYPREGQLQETIDWIEQQIESLQALTIKK